MHSCSRRLSSRPNGSPPVRIRSRAAPAISGRDIDSSRARILRSMVGTSAASDRPCTLSALSTPAASNRDCIHAVPPLSKVSSITHIPKTNVICRTSRLRVRGVKPSMLSIASSFPANARWLSTTPFGCPVEPDVNTMSAAPSSSRRGRGGFPAILVVSSSAALVTENLAPVAERMASVAVTGAWRATGTATPPASHVPMSAAASRGSLATGTSTGSSGVRPALRNACSMAAAASASSR
jgi:hypothetical protein